MQEEAAGLRGQYGMSVPTDGALSLIGKHAPLVGLGPGAAQWGELLAARGCDVVLDAAPAGAAAHGERALLLVWPENNGAGSHAIESLGAYTGHTLLLVGEWRGRTLAPSDGYSFAPAFQRAVEAQFELVEQARLPSWPPFLDGLMVWKRRRPTSSE